MIGRCRPALLLVAACSSLTDAGHSGRHVVAHLSLAHQHGTVDFAHDSAPTLMTIRSIGGGCTEAGPVEVTRSGENLRVTPYHWEPPEGTPCPRIFREIVHEVDVPAGVRWVRLTVQIEGEGETERTYGLGGAPRGEG